MTSGRAHLAVVALALGGLALTGCSGHPTATASAGATAKASASAVASDPAAVPASPSPTPASGTGLSVVAGHSVQFGAVGTPGVSGTFTLTCRGQGTLHLQPSKGPSTDLPCGGTSELRVPAGGTLVTGTTTSRTPLTLDWSLQLGSD